LRFCRHNSLVMMLLWPAVCRFFWQNTDYSGLLQADRIHIMKTLHFVTLMTMLAILLGTPNRSQAQPTEKDAPPSGSQATIEAGNGPIPRSSTPSAQSFLGLSFSQIGTLVALFVAFAIAAILVRRSLNPPETTEDPEAPPGPGPQDTSPR
jgi:hypothetical protein